MGRAEESERLGDSLVKQDLITKDELAEAKAREAKTGVPLYRQLLQMGKISASIVEDIMATEWHSPAEYKAHATFGDILLEMGALTKAQLEDALKKQKRTGRLLGNILLSDGVIDLTTRAKALGRQHGIEFAAHADTPSDPAALEAVSVHVAKKNEILPVRMESERLVVLIHDPHRREALAHIGVMVGKQLHPVLTDLKDIRAEIVKRYANRAAAPESPVPKPEPPPKKPPKSTASDKKTSPSKSKKKKEETPSVADTTPSTPIPAPERARFDDLARAASGVPVIRLVTMIIEGAINAGATDIHLDPQDPEMRVRYRIDGVLHDVMSIPSDIEAPVVSRIKIMADMDITETRHPQDGHISMDYNDGEFDVRVATLPTYLGERVVLRLLDQSSVLAGIKDLGLEPEDEKKLTDLVAQPYGMILVTGPTGSGKTTTLYAALNQKNVMTESIVTLEDPVEYQLSGINQVQIDTDIDLTFASTLRAAMRQDIDVLLVGEIRDPETARIAIRAAMTGHLVFSTLHTNDAPEAIATLRNMDIPAFLIESALTAVLGQRLIRKICPDCKKAFKPTKELLKSIGMPDTVKSLWRGAGCDTCYRTGNKGRTGIFEILEVNEKVRELISAGASPQELSKAVKLKTMSERCRQKVRTGVSEPEEFLRVIRT